jgi:predicted transposase/invertase (TIGR01784 family)
LGFDQQTDGGFMSAKIGIRAWIDFAFRKIFGKPGNEICLISLLNAILDLPQAIESVEFMNPFSHKDFEDDKLICVDVKATDQSGRVFIVEVQIVVHPSFAKRAVYYACKGYSDQLQVGQGYNTLKATYSVCLLMRKLFVDESLHHQFQLVERATGKVLEDSIEIHIVELSKYNGTFGLVPPSVLNGAIGSNTQANIRPKNYERFCQDWHFCERRRSLGTLK